MEAKDIIHPEDAKAIKAIKGIPGLEKAIACFMKFGFEQQFRGENLGNMIRVDAWNYPVLYHDFQELVKKLGIREPDLYIYNSPYMNAYTYGETSTFIALSSGLIEHLDREELKSVIGHECGHILCKHVLYKTILITLEEAGYLFGLIHKGLFLPIYGALQYWSRKSELSADRCASVLVGEEVFQSALAKLASGLKSDKRDNLIRQGRAYEEFRKSSLWNRLQQGYHTAFYSHPQLCVRALEVERWRYSFQYRHLFSLTRSLRYEINR